MAGYTMQHNQPWVGSSDRYSTAPSVSIYSEDDDGPRMDPEIPPPRPLDVRKPARSPYHAHPDQKITDGGPIATTSKLPVFSQVRSMLRKPNTGASNGPLKYDEFSGNPSETGKAAYMRASEYKLPYREVLKSQRRSLARPLKSVRSMSPVSTLRSEDNEGGHLRPQSPVSPVSTISAANDDRPDSSYTFAQRETLNDTPTRDYEHVPVPQIHMPKRKPVAAPSVPDSPVTSDRPTSPISRTEESIREEQEEDDENERATTPLGDAQGSNPGSHFSWTTYAPSIHPQQSEPRMSSDTHRQSDVLVSRFSWSTVATGMTRPSSPPPSPPQVPERFRQPPPVQSILSRQRPVPREDRDAWTPPPSSSKIYRAAAPSLGTLNTLTPPTSGRRGVSNSALPTSASSSKKLPLPPELALPNAAPMSHLETLLKQQENIIHQRKNIERLIAEDSKVEKASPIDVSYASVRDARKRLVEHKATLAEVSLEEREIGIAISRARRRDGEEDALWVRRVTH